MADELPPMPGILSSPVNPQGEYQAELFILLKALRDVLNTETALGTMTTSDVDPTTDDIPEDKFTVWSNTTTPSIRLYVNAAGVLKSVALT